MSKILDNILSVKNHGEHKTLTFLGFKINFKRTSFIQEKFYNKLVTMNIELKP